jgi:Ca2+-binding EF-hand superfamily protein
MSEADENEDGVLEYREFVPVMVEVVHGLKARESAAEEAEAAAADARAAVEMHLLHGVPREELETMMSGVFQAADADGSGTLDRKEFSSVNP